MKKLIATILILALAVPAFAQNNTEPKWSIKTTSGYFPTVPVLVDIIGVLFVAVPVAASGDEALEISLPPYFGVEGLYNFNEKWSLGASTGYLGTVWKIVDENNHKDVHSKTYLTFIPITVTGRCNYLNRPKVRLYGSLELGALFAVGKGLGVTPDFQINPFGVDFGRDFFGTVEFGVGMQYTGVRVGLGYRF